jgi:hypothetical protein
VSERALEGTGNGPARTCTIALSPAETREVETLARYTSMNFDDAAQSLFAEGLARRVAERLKLRPSAAVRRFHRGWD